MRIRDLKDLAGNVLFVLNVFIAFLLFFESSVSVPIWLQPLGRMHPMLLHFPIVLLMLAMVLEFFRFRPAYKNQEFYQGFTENLLVVGALSSAITVIMGLFLAREEGYSGEILQWHKWSGVSITFISTLIYWSRNSAWYKPATAKAAAFSTSFCLVLAGHYGAALTHGENFIMEPVSPQESNVPLEEALVFDHLIKPIFDKKCVSCHNPDKVKGNLMLTDEESILKGGKSGKLFVAGKPELSLLLERIHLPLEDKKHMAPKGKVQLTEQEIDILHYWIKSNGDFKRKVIELPETDSLRILAADLLKVSEKSEESFDFAAADEETIKRLNTDYRIISPIAKNSPALSVNFFSRSAFNSKSLEELNEIKSQIISLNLNKMPVKDADLKVIAGFENLRKLNLNFSDISGNELKELVPLKHLNSLSLSGTKVDYAGLKQLSAAKGLSEVTVWNTLLTKAEVQKFQKANPKLQLIANFGDDEKLLKLTPPELSNSKTVFRSSLELDLKHYIKGVTLRYTEDGKDPDSVDSTPFQKGRLSIRENRTFKVRAFKEGWLGSDVATFTFLKSAYQPDSISLLSQPAESNMGDGPETLINDKLGEYKPGSDDWLGYKNNDLLALLYYRKPVRISSVALNVMVLPRNNIFPPSEVEVWGGSEAGKMKLLKVVKQPAFPQNNKDRFMLVECKFPATDVLLIKVISRRQKTPVWKIAEDKKVPPVSFLFLDEILVN